MRRGWLQEAEENRFFSAYLTHLDKWGSDLVAGTVTLEDVRFQARRVADLLTQTIDSLNAAQREQLFQLLVEFAVLAMLQWAFLRQETEHTTSKPNT